MIAGNFFAAGRASVAVVLFTLLAVAVPARGADITSTWSAASSGNWNVPTNWNPVGVPNNGTQTFAAFITNPGTYTITLSTPITIESVLVSTSTATLQIAAGGTLTTGSIQLNGGTLQMAGGVISGATINPAVGTVIIGGTGNRLINNAVLQSNLQLPSGAGLLLASGGRFTGSSATLNTATLGHDQSVTYTGRTFQLTNSAMSIDGSNTMTIAATSTVRGSGTLTSDLFVAGTGQIINNGSILSNVASGTLRITPDIFLNTSQVIASGTASLLAGGGTFTNQGTISVTGGGTFGAASTFLTNSGTLIVAGIGSITTSQFANTGLVDCSTGTMIINAGSWNNAAGATIRQANGTLSLNGAWDNAGTIQVTNSQLNLGGTFTLGTGLNRSGGTVNLTGFLNNAGGTLLLNATTGSIELTGGTIAGGTINQSGGSLTYSNSANNRINGATLLGNLAMPGGRLAFTNGGTFTGNAATLTTAALGFDQPTTLAGRTITLSSGTMTIDGGNTMTLAADTLVRGSGALGVGSFVAGAGTIINNGTILSNVSGASIRVIADNFINNGSMIATGGATLTAAGANFTNTARIITSTGTDAFNSTASFTVNNATIQLAGNGTFTGGSLTNNGIISTGSATLRIVPTGSWTNSATGNISVSDGTLTLGGIWSNQGTITINNTQLALGGTITTAGIGTIVRNGGTVNLSAFVNNAGSTLNLNANTGDWQLTTGVISGGSIVQSGGNLLYSTSTTNRITNDGQLIGNLVMNSGRLVFGNGANFTGANATINTAGVGFDQTVMLTGKTFTLSTGTLSADGTSLVTLAADTVVQGSGAVTSGLFNSGNTVMVGNGFITGNVAGQTMRVSAVDFTNNGSITTVAGASFSFGGTQFVNNGTVSLLGVGSFGNTIMENNGLIESTGGATLNIAAATWSNDPGAILRINGGTLNLSGAWSNLGMIQVSGTTVNFGGTFNTASALNLSRTGGTLSLTGFLNNTGSTLALTAATGNWRLNGATITGGTITQNGGTLTYANAVNRLQNGATIIGDLEITGGRALFATGANFTGANANLGTAALGYEHTLTLAGRTFNMTAGTLGVDGNHTLTLASSTTVRGTGLITSDFFTAGESRFINNGTILANVSGGTLTVAPDRLINTGTLQASGGGKLIVTVAAGENLGRVRSDGTGSLVRITTGTYNVDQPIVINGGVVNLQGSFTQNANIDVSGRLVADYVDVNPFATLRAAIQSGYNGGAWNGNGINSSAATQAPNAGRSGVGYAASTAIFPTFPANFGGELVDDTAFLAIFTLYGDTNLDRTVSLDDFTRVAANFGNAGVWSSGDFNYDGVTNLDDFTVLASNFGLAPPAEVARSAVPEPAAAGLALVLLAGSMTRRRDRRAD